MLNLTFRVVGVYGFFENQGIPSLNPESTIEEIMVFFQESENAFNFGTAPVGNRELVDFIFYDFNNTSQLPPNTSFDQASDVPPGFRSSQNEIAPDGGRSLLWQYYRGVEGFFDGDPNTLYKIRIQSAGQPSFQDQRLNFTDGGVPFTPPPGFNIRNFTLTWRLVRFQIQNDLLIANLKKSKQAAEERYNARELPKITGVNYKDL